jgi:hypothetical protein
MDALPAPAFWHILVGISLPIIHAHARPRRFEGSDNYVATDDLKLAVNAALTLPGPC